ncbi:hypothetical protein V8C86DRAFT_2517822 [Haematococcus lacustris]
MQMGLSLHDKHSLCTSPATSAATPATLALLFALCLEASCVRMPQYAYNAFGCTITRCTYIGATLSRLWCCNAWCAGGFPLLVIWAVELGQLRAWVRLMCLVHMLNIMA